MTRWHKLIPVRARLTFVALTAASLATGCAAHVESGDGTADPESGDGAADLESGDGACSSHVEANCDGSNCPVVCEPGQTSTCSFMDPLGDRQTRTTECVRDPETCETYWDSSPCRTPLVLSFDRTPVDFTPAAASFDFDLTGTGRSVLTDWPTARTPWLSLDRDGDGRINGGGELFGSATRLADGSLAVNGFVALRALDDNRDGRITPEDKAWSRLLLWSDRDGDRASTAGELAQVSSRRLLSIDLGYTIDARCDARGNCEVERATFHYLDEAGVERTGDIVDVHLKTVLMTTTQGQ